MLANDSVANISCKKLSSKYKKWNRELHLRLFRQFRQTNDKKSLEQICREYEDLVVNLAKRFRRFNEPLDDLIQVGFLALIKAARRYNPDHGVEFSTYATACIIGEIKRYFRDKTWSFKVPRKLQELIPVIEAILEEFSLVEKNLSDQDIQKISFELDISNEEIREVLHLQKLRNTLSCDLEFHSSNESAGERPTKLTDYLGTLDKDLENINNQLTLQKIFQDLSKQQKTVIYLYFWQNLSQTKIAKILGISQVQISRILASSLKKIKGILLADQPRTERVPKPALLPSSLPYTSYSDPKRPAITITITPNRQLLKDVDESIKIEEDEPMKKSAVVQKIKKGQSDQEGQQAQHDQDQLYLTQKELLLAFLIAEQLTDNINNQYIEINVKQLVGDKIISFPQYLVNLRQKGVLEQSAKKAGRCFSYRLRETKFLADFKRGGPSMLLPSGKIINHGARYDLLDLVGTDKKPMLHHEKSNSAEQLRVIEKQAADFVRESQMRPEDFQLRVGPQPHKEVPQEIAKPAAMPPEPPTIATEEVPSQKKSNSLADVLSRLLNRKLQLEQEMEKLQQRLAEIPQLIENIEISIATIKDL